MEDSQSKEILKSIKTLASSCLDLHIKDLLDGKKARRVPCKN